MLLLHPGGVTTFETGDYEAFVLPLSGGCVVEVDGERFELAGGIRCSPASPTSPTCPRRHASDLSTKDGVEVALPMARCDRRLRPEYGPAEDVPVEVRGAGHATRQVTNFGVPGAWDHADKLIACELITPDGNWSSYPPHKHDHDRATSTTRRSTTSASPAATRSRPSREGFGFHRTYTDDGDIDEDVTVRDGDVFLIPRGYHGPCVAAPGYPMYYLNVLAGPDPERSMAFCDDPAHTWIRDTWASQDLDPRCPVTTAEGRVE